MSRRKTTINLIRADRVKCIIDNEGLSQQAFADKVNITQQHVSRIINYHSALVEDTARRIIEVFPAYNISWLLGDSETMLIADLDKEYVKEKMNYDNASIYVLDYAYRKICAFEGMKVEEVENVPELLLLQAQLKDYAFSLMWNYIKRDSSYVWTLLDKTK